MSQVSLAFASLLRFELDERYLGGMATLDVLSALLVFGGAGAFAFGALALARASDVEALFLLVTGIIALRAGVELVRPGANA